jgi:hypothetical protein
MAAAMWELPMAELVLFPFQTLSITSAALKGHSAQSDLFWRIHQNAALCYLLLFLCNWGV